MRATTVRLSTERRWFDPFDKVVIETAGVRREAIHEMRLVDDESAVMLYEYSGDREAVERLAERYLEPEHVECQVSEYNDDLLVYAHCRPNATVRQLLWALDEWKLIVDPPIRFSAGGDLVVTLIGDESEVRSALSNLPVDVRVDVERAGEFRPTFDRALGVLTPRELETLRTAVDLGYFENPRETNYEEIGRVLGRSKGTVGEHIRNAQSKIISEIMSHRSRDETAPVAKR